MSEVRGAAERIEKIRKDQNYLIAVGAYEMYVDADCRFLLAKLDAVRDVARKYAHPGCNTGCHGCGYEILRLLGDRP